MWELNGNPEERFSHNEDRSPPPPLPGKKNYDAYFDYIHTTMSGSDCVKVNHCQIPSGITGLSGTVNCDSLKIPCARKNKILLK